MPAATLLRSALAVGQRRRMALAFSRWRITPSDWSSLEASWDSRSPVIAHFCLASAFHNLWASRPQPPPCASATTGINLIPSSAHSDAVLRYWHLKSSYWVTAAELSWAESWTTVAETRSGSKVQGSKYASTPAWKKHVSRATVGIGVSGRAIFRRDAEQRTWLE